MIACAQPGCDGHIDADGYCDACGARAVPTARPVAPVAPPPVSPPAAPPPAPSAGPATSGSLATGSSRARGSRRTRTDSTRTTSRRTGIGAGLVDVPPAPTIDPLTVVLATPTVAESKRFCSGCGAPVGRAKGGNPGRLSGFCPRCRNPFDFVPKLGRGDRVGGQYEVVGCLAHGGLGWIYLARDRAVSDRWVVLKGLLDAGDAAARAVAAAERRFLAELEHPGIVGIVNVITHERAVYIVEDYVGGRSLKQILQARREANGGTADPLPVDQAIAFILAVLPAFTYLHDRRLLYCDFKPDNAIQVGDQIKLIDLGAVRRMDDTASDVYGTTGYQAPEIADLGPSVASDVYTIGRTLAVLTLDFKGFTSTHRTSLPDPADHPALARFGSFYRFLLKATAPHPDDRFQSVADMGEQLMGVLREVVAVTSGKAQPAPSSFFTVAADDDLPTLAVASSDPAAAFLATLAGLSPSAVLDAIDGALRARQVTATAEVRLRVARAHLDLGDRPAAERDLAEVEQEDPWEWRVAWLRGIADLAAGNPASAASHFERCRAELPGELAPQLAGAIAAERAGDLAGAQAYYDVVSVVDPSYVMAAVGLARCRAAADDVSGALAALQRVPVTHRARARAQLEAVRLLSGHGRFDEAADLLAGVEMDDHERAELGVDMYEHALAQAGAAAATGTLNGRPLTERDARTGLEGALRELAALTPDFERRCQLVDRANSVRPHTVL